MNKFFTILAVLFSYCAFAFDYVEFNVPAAKVVTKTKERGGSIAYQFNISGIQINFASEQTFTAYRELKVQGLQNFGKLGSPSLPAQSIIVEGTPAEFNVQVTPGDYQESLNVIPTPIMREKLRCLDCVQPDPNEQIADYNQDSPLYEVEYLGDFRDVNLTRITLFPVQYQAGSSTVKVYPRMYAKISKRSSREKAWNDFENPSSILKQADLNNNYLIIAPNKFIPAMADFTAWKKEMGYQVKVVSLESAGKTFNDIKKFIKQEYLATKFTYVLLVGEETIFPTNYVVTDNSDRTPSDLGYFTMGDNTDFIPDVFSGRLVISTVADIHNQVEKIMEYETSPNTNPAFKHFIGIASSEGSDPSDVEYLDEMFSSFGSKLGYQKTFFLESEDSNNMDITRRINNGAKWISYIGHGSGTAWASIGSGEYSTQDIAQLKPSSQKPIIIDVACENGRFKYNKFGERFMNQTNEGKPVGAAAYYGGSVSISWNPPAIMAIGINRYATSKQVTHIGEALLAGQMFLMQNNDNIDEVKDNLRWYHLFGDPSMIINL